MHYAIVNAAPAALAQLTGQPLTPRRIAPTDEETGAWARGNLWWASPRPAPPFDVGALLRQAHGYREPQETTIGGPT